MRLLPRFTVYLLWSPALNQVYLGYTRGLRQRLREHNAPDNSGWTKRGQPWRLLAVRQFLDRDSALLVEQRLKRSRYDKANWIRREESRLSRLRDQHVEDARP